MNLDGLEIFFGDNCMLMLLHLVERLGIMECYIAGWDGFSEKDNFRRCMYGVQHIDMNED